MYKQLCSLLLLQMMICMAIGQKHGTMVRRHSFNQMKRAEKTALHEVVFAVRQINLDILEAELLYRSTPGSPLYQKWLSYPEITELVANDESADILLEALRSTVGVEISWESQRRDYIKAVAPISTWETFFDTEFHEWRDTAAATTAATTSTVISREMHMTNNINEDKTTPATSRATGADFPIFLRAERYTIPELIENHVSAVFNTVQPPPVILHHAVLHPSRSSATSSSSSGKRRTIKDQERSLPNQHAKKSVFKTSSFSTSSLPSAVSGLLQSSASSSSFSSSSEALVSSKTAVGSERLTVSAMSNSPIRVEGTAAKPDDITIDYLNKLYSVPDNTGDSSLRQAIFQTNAQHFSESDLRKFQRSYHLHEQEAQTVVTGISTDYESPSVCSQSTTSGIQCWEGNQNIQYIMGIAQGVSTVYWYTGGADPFLDWILDVADEEAPPQVNSMSWGTTEQEYSVDSMTQFNIEAMKLAAMGVTIVVSSADNGAHGNECDCSKSSSSSSSPWGGNSTWSGSGYFPSFPATCPYVTAVGATMGPEQGKRREIVAQSDLGGQITSGGGFSTFFSQPSWQHDPVQGFLDPFTTAGTTSGPAAGYNMHGRAYPDVSLLGVRYKVIVGGDEFTLYGTAAAAPVFAGFISLINSRRLSNNMSQVGFINPTLYDGQNKEFFNDVISGDNKCCASSSSSSADSSSSSLFSSPTCCESGFSAGEYWDPVSGLGSIDYLNLAFILEANAPTNAPTFAPSKESENKYGLLDALDDAGLYVLKTNEQKIAVFIAFLFTVFWFLVLLFYFCWYYKTCCWQDNACCWSFWQQFEPNYEQNMKKLQEKFAQEEEERHRIEEIFEEEHRETLQKEFEMHRLYSEQQTDHARWEAPPSPSRSRSGGGSSSPVRLLAQNSLNDAAVGGGVAVAVAAAGNKNNVYSNDQFHNYLTTPSLSKQHSSNSSGGSSTTQAPQQIGQSPVSPLSAGSNSPQQQQQQQQQQSVAASAVPPSSRRPVNHPVVATGPPPPVPLLLMRQQYERQRLAKLAAARPFPLQNEKRINDDGAVDEEKEEKKEEEEEEVKGDGKITLGTREGHTYEQVHQSDGSGGNAAAASKWGRVASAVHAAGTASRAIQVMRPPSPIKGATAAASKSTHTTTSKAQSGGIQSSSMSADEEEEEAAVATSNLHPDLARRIHAWKVRSTRPHEENNASNNAQSGSACNPTVVSLVSLAAAAGAAAQAEAEVQRATEEKKQRKARNTAAKAREEAALSKPGAKVKPSWQGKSASAPALDSDEDEDTGRQHRRNAGRRSRSPSKTLHGNITPERKNSSTVNNNKRESQKPSPPPPPPPSSSSFHPVAQQVLANTDKDSHSDEEERTSRISRPKSNRSVTFS